MNEIAIKKIMKSKLLWLQCLAFFGYLINGLKNVVNNFYSKMNWNFW